MINVTIINLKSISKYLLCTAVLVCVVYIANFTRKKITFNSELMNINLIGCLNDTLPKISEDNNIHRLRDVVSTSRGATLKRMLSVELPMMDNIIVDGEEIDEIKPAEDEDEEDDNIEIAKTDVETSEIEENNITPKYNQSFGSVKVKNESDKEITEEILTPNMSLENNKDIIIFHTHTCESYTPSENFNYEMTGSYRTTDLNYSVSRVGDELSKYLTSYGYNVKHDKTYHDYPAYSGSYGRSLTTVQNILNKDSNAQIVIDLHRDAVGSNANYAPSVKIGDEVAAQMMFVIGTDGGGLEHLNWQQNLKFAVKMQEKANELYPGLFRPIIVRNSRYNQHLTKASVIIEVGATGNTMEECLVSMKYLSKIISEIVK